MGCVLEKIQTCSICKHKIIIDYEQPFKCTHKLHISCNKQFYQSNLIYQCPLCRAQRNYNNIEVPPNRKKSKFIKYIEKWPYQFCLNNHSLLLKEEKKRVIITCKSCKRELSFIRK